MTLIPPSLNPVPAEMYARMREDRDHWHARAIEAERRVDELLFIVVRQGALQRRHAARISHASHAKRRRTA